MWFLPTKAAPVLIHFINWHFLFLIFPNFCWNRVHFVVPLFAPILDFVLKARVVVSLSCTWWTERSDVVLNRHFLPIGVYSITQQVHLLYVPHKINLIKLILDYVAMHMRLVTQGLGKAESVRNSPQRSVADPGFPVGGAWTS